MYKGDEKYPFDYFSHCEHTWLGSSGTFLSASHDKTGTLAWVEERMAKATMIPRAHGEVHSFDLHTCDWRSSRFFFLRCSVFVSDTPFFEGRHHKILSRTRSKESISWSEANDIFSLPLTTLFSLGCKLDVCLDYVSSQCSSPSVCVGIQRAEVWARTEVQLALRRVQPRGIWTSKESTGTVKCHLLFFNEIRCSYSVFKRNFEISACRSSISSAEDHHCGECTLISETKPYIQSWIVADGIFSPVSFRCWGRWRDDVPIWGTSRCHSWLNIVLVTT